MKLFGRKKREIERLNKEVERLQNAHADRWLDINGLIDNPYSERSIKLKFTRSIDLSMEKMMWEGDPALTKPLNFGGFNVILDPTIAIVNVEP